MQQWVMGGRAAPEHVMHGGQSICSSSKFAASRGVELCPRGHVWPAVTPGDLYSSSSVLNTGCKQAYKGAGTC